MIGEYFGEISIRRRIGGEEERAKERVDGERRDEVAWDYEPLQPSCLIKVDT